MGSAQVIAPVDGQPDWYLVKDHLGVQYNVQSSVADFPYVIGKEYRLFVPGGIYDTCAFRLQPYATSRKWRSAKTLAKTHPATAAVMHLHNKKLLDPSLHDSIGTIADIQPYGGDLTAIMTNRVRAIILPDDANYDLYEIGDVVTIITETIPGAKVHCIKQKGTKKRWIAGIAKGKPKKDCESLAEDWAAYYGAVNFAAGGDNLGLTHPVPGTFYYKKNAKAKHIISKWKCRVPKKYLDVQSQYPATFTASADGSFEIVAGGSPCFDNRRLLWTIPAPMMMDGSSSVFAFGHSANGLMAFPPAVAEGLVYRSLKCKNTELHMTFSLSTFNEKTGPFYSFQPEDKIALPWAGINGSRNQYLPGCMILVFDKSPIDYLPGSAINTSLLTAGLTPLGEVEGLLAVNNTVEQIHMDKPFKLVYATPGAATFKNCRIPLPMPGLADQFALARSWSRIVGPNLYRIPIWSERMAGYDIGRLNYNVPMDDPETGFQEYGELLTRCFNYAGQDVTPTREEAWNSTDYYFGLFEPAGGFFPGMFELDSTAPVTRNLCRDFLAAYPFMANPAFNPKLELPKLLKVVLWCQGNQFIDPASAVDESMFPQYGHWWAWRIDANTAHVKCGPINFQYVGV